MAFFVLYKQFLFNTIDFPQILHWQINVYSKNVASFAILILRLEGDKLRGVLLGITCIFARLHRLK